MREGRVGADLGVDLDETLHENGLSLTAIEGVLETTERVKSVIFASSATNLIFLGIPNEPVTDEHDQRQAVTELVRTGRGLRSIGSGHLVQEPVRRGAEALLVLLSVSRNCQSSWSQLKN